MLVRKHIKLQLIFALLLLAVGGYMIHTAAHNPTKVIWGYVPYISGLLGVIAIPVLFLFRRTLHLANILNGFTCIIGVITMMHFALAMVRPNIYADVLILIAKFYVGQAIFSLELFNNIDAPRVVKGWNLIRYPNIGFWYVHLITLAAVYALGHFLWR